MNKKIIRIADLFLIFLIVFSSAVHCEDVSAAKIKNEFNNGEVIYYDRDKISETLDLSGKRINSLTIKNSIVEGKIILKGATVESGIDLTNTTFKSTAVFDGMKFRGATSFKNAKFEADASFNASEFTKDVVDTTVDNNIVFSNSVFKNKSLFINSKFFINAEFENAIFDGDAYFNDSEFIEDIKFSDSIFKNKVVFISPKFKNGVEFENVTFGGEAYFDESEFNDKDSTETTIFTDSKFMSNASFKSTEFYKNGFFYNTTFNKKAIYTYAKFDGLMDFRNAIFNEDIDFESAQFANPANFGSASINGTINFASADVKADLSGVKSLGKFIHLNNSNIGGLNVDPGKIITDNLSKEMLYSILTKYEDQNRSSGEIKRLYYDHYGLPPKGFLNYIIYMINRYILRWCTWDGITNIAILFFVSTFFIFPILYLSMACIESYEKNTKKDSALTNRIYDSYYFSITNALNQRSGELKSRRCSWTALLQFILSALFFSLIAYVLAVGRLII